jgi:hypothetical protein
MRTHGGIYEPDGFLADSKTSIVDHGEDGPYDGGRCGGSEHQGELTINLELA